MKTTKQTYTGRKSSRGLPAKGKRWNSEDMRSARVCKDCGTQRHHHRLASGQSAEADIIEGQPEWCL